MAAEIERVFLLRGHPDPMPAGETWRIEQGYLPPSPHEGTGDAGLLEGRLRRIERPDGSVRHVHTVKRGTGLVREEVEREIDAATFAREWPRTEGRRLSKVRTRIRVGDRTWEVDRFTTLPIALAECELPTADAPLAIPAWLAPWIDREVTDDPAYRNYELARRAGLVGGGDRYHLHPAMSFTCAIVTPSDAVLDTPATYASFEAWDGQQGVAGGASAFLTRLGTGVVSVQAADGARRVFVLDGGFAQMDGARLTLLTERAMEGSGIDLAAAERELSQANAKVMESGARPATLDERASMERAQRLARAKIAAAQLVRG